MTKLIVYLALLILATSCTLSSPDVTGKKQLTLLKNYSFYSGFQTGNCQVETLNDQDYFCAADFKTHKKIAIHSLKDTSTYFIDLTHITDLGEKIMAYEIISLDTIMILTRGSNRVYFINQAGEIFHKLDFNEVLNGVYTLRRSSTPFQYNDTSLLFLLGYQGVNTSFKTDEGIRRYSEESLNAMQILKVDNFKNDSFSTNFIIPNIRSRFMSPDDLQSGGSSFSFDNKIIFHSYYSDSIYLIDPFTFNINQIKQIESKYTQSFIHPVAYNEHNLVSQNYHSNGWIHRIIYDDVLQLYYCSVMHKSTEAERPWSLIVLDQELNKIDEIFMERTKYSAFMFLCKDGLLISNYYETKNDTDFYLKNTMSLFRYE